MKKNQLKHKILFKSELMEEILAVRYTDLSQEKALCKKLLGLAEPEHDTYACAFANVYLFDSHLALGEYHFCDFYLVRARMLCEEHGYEDLYLTLCNCAGLYYLKLNDEQTALSYYLEGLKIAKDLGDYDMESKLLNNIGIGFGGRDDWASAKEYFFQAYQAIRPHLNTVDHSNVISYLCNFSEAALNLGKIEESDQAIRICEELNIKSPYHKLRLICGKATRYAILNDRENCIKMEDLAVEEGLLSFDSKMFVCDMCISSCEDMIKFNDQQRAERYLKILDEKYDDATIVLKYRILCLKISFYQKYNMTDELEIGYKEYYTLVKKLNKMDNESRSQSMLSKVQLTTVMLKREDMHKKNIELENAGQLDELTGLYNRRYFNKLISKYAQNQIPTKSMGFIMVDVDFFKQYNDFYGHFQGDDILKAVGNTLSKWAVDGIFVSRYGGDEFVCLCIDLTDDEISDYIHNVEKDIADQNIAHACSTASCRLSLSIGFCNEKQIRDLDTLIKLADDALYIAKREGRNRHAHKKSDEPVDE